MIWLKENHRLVGYVPILKKDYNEEEIRQMSEYHCYQGWSALSRFVMKIQGIEFVHHEVVETKRIVDIVFGFDFECFYRNDDSRMETYISQIFEVFQNLILYKLKEFSEKEAKKEIAQAKKILEGFVSIKTLSNFDNDFLSILYFAEKSSDNLSNLQKIFKDMRYTLDKSHLFANIDESITKEIYKKRKKTRLEMRD